MKLFIAALLTAIGISFGAQAAAIDVTTTPQTFTQLATICNSGTVGSRATITDGPVAPTWGSSVTAGGGPTTVAIYCDGTVWKVYGGGGLTTVVVAAVLPAPVTNQGTYATGCSGASCRTFDDHWAASSLDTSKWFPGLVINTAYLDGAIGLAYPYSGWTVCNCNGGTGTVFLDYPYGYPNNPVGLNFSPLKKAADGSLQLTFAPNNYFAGSGANYIGAAISSAYTSATEIPHTGGLMQWRMKLDNGLQYGSYPGMQCSASGAHYPADSGTTYNANFEFGYTWTGTPLTNVGFGVNNLSASTANGGTLPTGVGAVPSTNNLTNWHTFALEYTGDSGTRKWQYYIDGVLQNTANTNHPVGTDFNCSWQMFNSVSANNSWHSGMSTSNPPPFSMWISDIQFYKKPGT